MSARTPARKNRRNQALAKRAQAVLFQNYGARDLALVRGKGTTVWDADGNSYLDFICGIAVTALGHSHPAVTKIIRTQSEKILHTSNLYLIEPQIALAEELVKRSFADRAFFCNSGTEAVEAAIKLARRWGQTQKKGKNQILVAERGFHGRTYGALSATPKKQYHKGFGPMLPGFKALPFGDAKAFETAANDRTCAILIEPAQGEGGVYVGTRDFLNSLRKLCDQKKMLLIFDEIQVGMGRTGKLFAYEHYNVVPDVITLAKALGNGVPVGAMLAKNDIAMLLDQGSHGTTFGGNFLATATAHAVVKQIAKPATLKNVERQGVRLRNGLEELAAKHKGRVKEIRGIGLLAGLELKDEPAGPVLKAARERGLLIGTAGPNTLRFAPPLLVKSGEVDKALRILDQALEATAS